MKIRIENFMCHEKLQVDFNNLSIISGENGSGKSAIFHSINWLINGGTNNFIRNGTNTCKVSLEIDNNIYSREVNKSKYIVTKNNEVICTTKDSLKELGINIPLEFFNQFDKLFLLNETPKNRADLLNSMFDIENLELGLSDVTKDLKNDKGKLENCEANLNTMITKYDKLQENLSIIKNIKSKTDFYADKLDKLNSIINSKSRLKVVPNIIKQNINMDIIIKLQKLINLRNSIKLIPDKIINDINITTLKKLNNIIKLKQNKKTIPQYIDINIDTNKINNLKNIKIMLDKIHQNMIQCVELKNELENINDKLKKEECPLCKRKM